jgi:hypothetical protein
MEWLVPYHWSAALGAPIAPWTWWSWHRPPFSELVTDEGCVEPATLELELIGVVYGVLVEEVACADCGAPLDRSVKVELPRRTFAAPRILVATRCCGRQEHRHVARVAKRAGDLRFGQLSLDDSH